MNYYASAVVIWRTMALSIPPVGEERWRTFLEPVCMNGSRLTHASRRHRLAPYKADTVDADRRSTTRPRNGLLTAHEHTHTFNSPLSRTTRVSRYQKGKPIWILLKQETVSGSGISWAICKSAPCSRQITTPAPHHSVFRGRMPFLPSNQQRQSTEDST